MRRYWTLLALSETPARGARGKSYWKHCIPLAEKRLRNKSQLRDKSDLVERYVPVNVRGKVYYRKSLVLAKNAHKYPIQPPPGAQVIDEGHEPDTESMVRRAVQHMARGKEPETLMQSLIMPIGGYDAYTAALGAVGVLPGTPIDSTEDYTKDLPEPANTKPKDKEEEVITDISALARKGLESTGTVFFDAQPESTDFVRGIRDPILEQLRSTQTPNAPMTSPEAAEILQAFYDAAVDPLVVAGLAHVLSPTTGVRNVMIVSRPGLGKSVLFDELRTQIDEWWEKQRYDCIANSPFADVLYQDRPPSDTESVWGIQFLTGSLTRTITAPKNAWMKPIERYLKTKKPLLIVLDEIAKYPPNALNELQVALAKNALRVELPSDFPLEEYAGKEVEIPVRVVGLANPNPSFFENPDNAALLNRFAIYKFFKRRWLSPAHANIAGLKPEPEIGTAERKVLGKIDSLLDDFGDSQGGSPVRFYGKAMELLGKQGAHLYGSEADLVYSRAVQRRFLTAKDLEDKKIADRLKQTLHTLSQEYFPTLDDDQRNQIVEAQFGALKRRLHNANLLVQALADALGDEYDPQTHTYTPKNTIRSQAFGNYWGIRLEGSIHELIADSDSDEPNVGGLRNLRAMMSALMYALSDAPSSAFREGSPLMEYVRSELLDPGALNKLSNDERREYQAAITDFLNRVSQMRSDSGDVHLTMLDQMVDFLSIPRIDIHRSFRYHPYAPYQVPIALASLGFKDENPEPNEVYSWSVDAGKELAKLHQALTERIKTAVKPEDGTPIDEERYQEAPTFDELSEEAKDLITGADYPALKRIYDSLRDNKKQQFARYLAAYAPRMVAHAVAHMQALGLLATTLKADDFVQSLNQLPDLAAQYYKEALAATDTTKQHTLAQQARTVSSAFGQAAATLKLISDYGASNDTQHHAAAWLGMLKGIADHYAGSESLESYDPNVRVIVAGDRSIKPTLWKYAKQPFPIIQETQQAKSPFNDSTGQEAQSVLNRLGQAARSKIPSTVLQHGDPQHLLADTRDSLNELSGYLNPQQPTP